MTITRRQAALGRRRRGTPLCGVGAGVIGLERGSVWRRLGSEVVVVESLDHILTGMDAEVSKFMQRTLEKQRVIGGGPRFRKFGRRVLYSIDDLEVWANSRTFEMTSDPGYAIARPR